MRETFASWEDEGEPRASESPSRRERRRSKHQERVKSRFLRDSGSTGKCAFPPDEGIDDPATQRATSNPEGQLASSKKSDNSATFQEKKPPGKFLQRLQSVTGMLSSKEPSSDIWAVQAVHPEKSHSLASQAKESLKRSARSDVSASRPDNEALRLSRTPEHRPSSHSQSRRRKRSDFSRRTRISSEDDAGGEPNFRNSRSTMSHAAAVSMTGRRYTLHGSPTSARPHRHRSSLPTDSLRSDGDFRPKSEQNSGRGHRHVMVPIHEGRTDETSFQPSSPGRSDRSRKNHPTDTSASTIPLSPIGKAMSIARTKSNARSSRMSGSDGAMSARRSKLDHDSSSSDNEPVEDQKMYGFSSGHRSIPEHYKSDPRSDHFHHGRSSGFSPRGFNPNSGNPNKTFHHSKTIQFKMGLDMLPWDEYEREAMSRPPPTSLSEFNLTTDNDDITKELAHLEVRYKRISIITSSFIIGCVSLWTAAVVMGVMDRLHWWIGLAHACYVALSIVSGYAIRKRIASFLKAQILLFPLVVVTYVVYMIALIVESVEGIAGTAIGAMGCSWAATCTYGFLTWYAWKAGMNISRHKQLVLMDRLVKRPSPDLPEAVSPIGSVAGSGGFLPEKHSVARADKKSLARQQSLAQ